jgi:hypothetical protein
MGLDQFAYKMKYKPSKEVDFAEELEEGAVRQRIIDENQTGQIAGELFVDGRIEEEELHYWRKHPNLQGWMENLYREKGGQDGDFNCAPVLLNAEDLKRLKKDLKENNLPETSGFFFGTSDDDDVKEDLKFVKDALKAIEEGYTVYYSSWW